MPINYTSKEPLEDKMARLRTLRDAIAAACYELPTTATVERTRHVSETPAAVWQHDTA